MLVDVANGSNDFKLFFKDATTSHYDAYKYLYNGNLEKTKVDLLTSLVNDLNNTKYELKKIFDSDISEIEIWKKIKDDPFYAGEFIKESTDTRWLKWKDREFFKVVTKKGNYFEIAMLNKVKTKTGPEYEKLLKEIPDIGERKLISQMQFCLPGFKIPCKKKGEYFIADQVWIKYDNRGRIQDMVVVDAKLSEGTALTSGQTAAKNQSGKGSLAYKPIDSKIKDETSNLDLPDEINQGILIEIKSFYKLFGDGNSNFVGLKKL
ncbi:hypothetical protein LPBF_11260 [Flavobacterium crassostreae]|uniref:Uncharacterized protein n=2 Tax=Flavobacterium crassostreae TaxID=1763534 RepID=A0A1B9DTH6_9FLAO|nr:hypothetical protein LPBF_11260 [Flavobacterium crassostreae]